MLTFATALAGITVLAPAAVKPPAMPWTSKVGRDQTRSRMRRPGSPVRAEDPTSWERNCASSKGSESQLASSAAAGSSTSS